jgi:hypothetical protein
MRGGDAAVAEPVPVRVGVVALVRAQFGRSAASGSAGADGRQAGHHGLQGLAVVGVGRGHPDHQRDARGVGENLQLGAGFGAVDRVGAGQRSPFWLGRWARPGSPRTSRSPPARRADPGSPDAAGPRDPLGPGGKPPVRGRRRHPERRRQMPPRAAAGQHEHDRDEHRPIVHRSGASTLPAWLEPRHQRRRQLPQTVRNQPRRKMIIHTSEDASSVTPAT